MCGTESDVSITGAAYALQTAEEVLEDGRHRSVFLRVLQNGNAPLAEETLKIGSSESNDRSTRSGEYPDVRENPSRGPVVDRSTLHLQDLGRLLDVEKGVEAVHLHLLPRHTAV